ncbi:MAG: hypothetical protein QOI46_2990 [Alphaproteobacteria bacterium]|nr:hypothetical protein [Alphaproteobacteria bacterium]
MIAQLPADRMPPPRPIGISHFERLFRVAGGLDIDKSDIKRHEDFVNRKIYDLLICADETARLNGRDVIELRDLPLTQGLRGCIGDFKQIDETVELRPILDYIAKWPPLSLGYSDETKAEFPNIAGGISVAVARTFKLVDPELKNPQTKHWERAHSIFSLLL